MAEVDWVPGIISLLLGVILGQFLIYRQISDGEPGVDERAGRLEDLRREKQRLFAALKDLKDTDEAVGVAIAPRERAELELRAAEVLRLIAQAEGTAAKAASKKKKKKKKKAGSPETAEEVEAWTDDKPEPAKKAPAPAPGAGSSEAKGMLKAGLVVAFVAIIAFALSRGAVERTEGMGITGPVPETVTMEVERSVPPGSNLDRPAPPDRWPAASPRLDHARGLVAERPDDVDAWIELGYALVQSGGNIEAFGVSEEILERSPGHPEGLTIQGIVRVAMGQPDLGDDLFAQALAANPDQVTALTYRGLIALQAGDRAGAKAFWVRALDVSVGEDSVGLQQFIALADSDEPIPQLLPPAGGHAPGGGPADADHPPHSEAPAAAGLSIEGTIRLAEGATPAPGAVLYVIGRRPGSPGGRPAAVRKLLASGFPVTFTLGPNDDPMQTGQFPAELQLSARLDTDGDAKTDSATDLLGSAGLVRAGAEGVEIVLSAR